MNQNKTFAYLALAAGMMSLSLSAMFVRWADAPGPVTGFYRLLISAILLLPFFVFQQTKQPVIPRKHIIIPIAAGLFTAFDFAFWNTSVHYTSAANATLLGNTSPLWVAMAAFFILKEKLAPKFWAGLAIALTGAVLIIGTDFLLHPTLGIGDIMAVAASLFYAGYQLITQHGRKFIDPFRYTWIVTTSATLCMFGINLILGNRLTGYSTQTWWAFLGTAVVSQMIGYLAISYALGHLPASIVAPTMIGQPVLTILLAIPLLGEVPSALQWAGGLIALAGIYIVNQSHSPAEQTPNA